MGFYQDAAIELQHIQRTISEIEQKLAVLPEGDFSLRTNGNGCKYYRVMDAEPSAGGRRKHQFVYISKSNREYAADLALRKYYQTLKEDLLGRAAAIRRLQRTVEHGCSHAEQLMAQKNFAELVEPRISTGEEEMRAWAAQDYVRNMDHPEYLKVPTEGGIMVRSKSEALIANMLTERGLAFRYENQTSVGTRTVYPDFTIWHPERGNLVIWEHFGMIGMQAYQSQIQARIDNYIANGYLTYKNFITTYESSEDPFDTEFASKIIRMMFDR